jgi:hypothetical protein
MPPAHEIMYQNNQEFAPVGESPLSPATEQNNILDPAFWNRVQPLPVIAIEAAASQFPQNPNVGFDGGASPSSFLEESVGINPGYAPMSDLNRYDNYDRRNPLIPTSRDWVFSRAVRAQQHQEPILPDLPVPPVVLA